MTGKSTTKKKKLSPIKPSPDAEKEARRKIIEELFQDFNRSRAQVYRMNFIRGIFFGFGSVLGGTILVTLVVWLLANIGQHIPYFGDFFEETSETLQQR